MSDTQKMTERQELIAMISDTYKELNGFRPRWNFSAWETHMLRDELNCLQEQVRAELAAEKAALLEEQARMNPSPAWTIGDIAWA